MTLGDKALHEGDTTQKDGGRGVEETGYIKGLAGRE